MADRFPRITEAALAALRERIGVPIEDTLEPWCHEATRDAIRHYAHGVGDDNPLWCDPAYARTTRWGDVIAPPSFVFPLDRVLSGYVGGLPGIHAMWAGARFRWHEPMRRGDAFESKAWLSELVPHETRFSGRAIQQIYRVDLTNQRGARVCEAESWCFRTERDTAREEGTKYAELRERPEVRWTRDALDEFYAGYERETRRGGEPLRIQDVRVGDTLPRMRKGPMTVTGFIAYAQGWGGLYIRANRLAWQQLRKHAGLGIENRFGIPDVPERVHWEDEMAHTVGAPGAYDYGPERCSWLIHQVTDWMGDDAFLESAWCEIRRHNPVGDALTLDAEITALDPEHGTIEIEQRATNQNGELSARGGGVVRGRSLSC